MNIKKILKTIIPLTIRQNIHAIQYAVLKDIFYFAHVQPNKILFLNFGGRGFGGDPKYICLELLKQSQNFDLVWSLQNPKEPLPSGVRPVFYGGLKFYYEMATAKVIIFNTAGGTLAYYLRKKSQQFALQTWHGSHAFKYIEHQAEESLPKEYLRASDQTVSMTDVFLSDGAANTKFLKDSFRCTCPIIETGMPHEDILFSNNQEDKNRLKRLREKLGINKSKKVLLYAPTFRDDGSMEAYDLNFKEVLSAMHHKFDGEWIALLRFHPNVSHINKIPTDGKVIINVSKYGDVQELIAISDVLITDYSSIYHDFFITNKPVFLYTKDIEHYIAKDRQLRPEYFKIGLNRNKTMATLLKDIMNFNLEAYQNLVMEYRKETGAIADGKATQRVVEYIKQYLQ